MAGNAEKKEQAKVANAQGYTMFNNVTATKVCAITGAATIANAGVSILFSKMPFIPAKAVAFCQDLVSSFKGEDKSGDTPTE